MSHEISSVLSSEKKKRKKEMKAGGRRRKIMVSLEDSDKGIYALDWALNYLIPPASDSTQPDHFVILYVLPPVFLNTTLVNEGSLLLLLFLFLFFFFF